MSEKPYLISSITGNSRLLACYDERGQLHRLFWPQIDYPQNINQHYLGLFLHEEGQTHWLQDDRCEANQEYITDTNIVRTSLNFHLVGYQVVLEDFAVPDADVLVRHLTIKNLFDFPRDTSVVLFSNMNIGGITRYHTSQMDFESDALLQYYRQYYFLYGSDVKVTGYQCGGCFENACGGNFLGNPHTPTTDGSLSFYLGTIDPQQTKEFTLYIAMGSDKKQAEKSLTSARAIGYKTLKELACKQCQEVLGSAKSLNTSNHKVLQLYRRSLLTMTMLSDYEYGGIIAAPEFDEGYTRSGGYGYCWGRDAGFITTSMDRAGLHKYAEAFYTWAAKAQSPSGRWEQRHYLNGMVAPTWGIQIDETGTILYGIYNHFEHTGNKGFLELMWPTVLSAVEYLLGFVDKGTGLPLPSHDLWEERVGEHTYSAAAVYGGLRASVQIAKELGKDDVVDLWVKAAEGFKKAIEKSCYDNNQQRFVRSIKLNVQPWEYDQRLARGEMGWQEHNSKGYVINYIEKDLIVDSSLIGVSIPYEVLPPEDYRVKNTVDAIRKKLWFDQVGGLKRYENDNYIGGNPWILTTCWLGLYYVETNQFDEAKKILTWVLDKTNSVGLLPEQVDKFSGRPVWVIPLTWSHAMYLHLVLALAENNQL